MKIFLLDRPECDYDEASGFVIMANSEEEAREIASKIHSWPKHVAQEWFNKDLVSCEELTGNGEAGLILESFHAG